MELYLNIIKAFLNKEQWSKYHQYIDKEFLRKNYPELQKIFNSLGKLHDVIRTEGRDPSVADLEGIFYVEYPATDRDIFNRVFQRIREVDGGSKEVLETFLNNARWRAIATEYAFNLLDFAEGKPNAKRYEEIVASIERPQVLQLDEYEFVNDDIDYLYETSVADGGLSWRLEALRRSLGPLRKGDFGFIFARPETGKTSFLASEITNFASQLKDGDGPILWFNNEEVHEKVLLRCYTSCLGVPLERVLANRPKAREAYYERTRKKIDLPKLESTHRRDIERICERYKPSLIVCDQLDKVDGFDGDREDLLLGAIYRWARELAKQYAPVIGVSQADGSAEGVKRLNMGHVANAKTSKQQEADWIAGIGLSYDDPPNVRCISICKNKLIGGEESIPELRHGYLDVILDPLTGRYADTI